MEIHSAPWLISICDPVVKDGSVVVTSGTIIDHGPRDSIVLKYPYAPEIQHQCILMPALINAHMHLELSHLNDIPEPSVGAVFTDWVSNLIHMRAERSDQAEHIANCIDTVLTDQHNSGVILIGDICNDLLPLPDTSSHKARPDVMRILEILAPTQKAIDGVLEKLPTFSRDIMVTGHAPYSTGPEALLAIKARSRDCCHTFSIHTAETREEIQFVQSGSGCFRDFLDNRNGWDGSLDLHRYGSPAGAVNYLDTLGILDEMSLLVHCVHVSLKELDIIKEKMVKVCICPGSNRFLQVGRAPVEDMLAKGIIPAIGTDSAASNRSLDMWREMRIMAEDHPGVAHADILSMATLGGARALNRDDSLGFLGKGAHGTFLHASSPSLMECSTADRLLEILVTGERPSLSWVENTSYSAISQGDLFA